VSALLDSQLVRTVLLGAAGLGAICGLLGAFAVLRRQSLLSDTLSHAALPGICAGFLVAGERALAPLLAGALVTGLAAAGAVAVITRHTRLKMDAALGTVLGVSFALGVVLLTWVQAQGAAGAAGLDSFLFGQAAAIVPADLWVIGAVGALALALVLALWKEFKLITFDPDSARAAGLPVGTLEMLLTGLIALAVVIGLQLVGVVLMVALMIAPAAAARQWCTRLGPMVALSVALGAGAGAAGALVSASARGLATGPVVVLIATAVALVSVLLAPGRGVVWAMLARARARAALEESQVLDALHALAQAHDDPRYKSEQGMLGTALGTAPPAQRLAALERRGLVRAVRHAPETTPHWALTAAGHAARTRAAPDARGRA